MPINASAFPAVASNRKEYDPLPILISARIRLNDEQRLILKDALNKMRDEAIPAPAPVRPGSSIRTETAQRANLGKLSDLTLSQLITSRESIPLGTVLQISEILGVSVISDKDIMKATQQYCDWMFHGKKVNA